MAHTALTLSMDAQDHQISSEDISNNCTNITTCSTGDGEGLKHIDDLQCFVCDVKIQGRHYTLATCRTQTTRLRVIEKLGELVGERYMVLISEDDVICRSCANLINTLDRLEVEMRNVRNNVLRFLEQKYSLQEGELLDNNEKSKRSQPPQITKCGNQNTVNWQGKKRNASASLNASNKDKIKKSNTWMQCNKCRYTTLHNSFMVHHIRDYSKQKMCCNKCGTQFSSNQQSSHNCGLKDQLTTEDIIQEKKSEFSMHVNETAMKVSALEKSLQQDSSIMSVQTYSESQISNLSENIPLLRLPNSDDLHIENILTSDNTTSSGQQIYIRVLQPVDVNHEPMQSSMTVTSNSDSELVVKLKDTPGKQILTLTEDGNLEMVEVSCWNDVQSAEPHSNITFD